MATVGQDADPGDAELVRLALGGEDAAFTRLAARHKSWLFRFIRRYVGNDDDAFDLLQDSMVSTWLALDRYDGRRPFPAWLRTIALNKCRDWSRRRMLRRIVGCFAGDFDLFAAEPRVSNPEVQLTASQAMLRLDRAIASLPVALREPFILTVFEGLSQRETAQQLRVSEKAVETRVYRARQRLSRAIEKSDLRQLIENTAQ